MIWSSRDYSKTGDYWRSALELARGVGHEALLAHSLNRVGNWYLNVEQPVEAIKHHEEALRIFENIRDIAGLAETVDLLGMAWFLSGDMAKSRAYYERALPLFEQLHDNHGYVSSLSTLSVCCPVYHTDTLQPAITFDQGAEWLARAEAMASEIGWRAGESYALFEVGLVLGPAGEYARALDSTLSALAIAQEISHLAWKSASLCTLGSIQMDLLDLEAAKDTLERAYSTAKETGSLHWIRVSAGFLARCYVALGRTAQAKAEALLDETLPAEAGFRTLGQRAVALARTELALALKQPNRALELVQYMIEATGNRDYVPPGLGKLRGDALVQVGEYQRAEAAFLQAAELAHRQGQRRLLWRIHAALSRLYRGMGQRSRAAEERQKAVDLIEGLAETLSNQAQRGTFLSAATAQLPSPLTQRQAAKVTFGGLTEREREIASLISRGLSNAEIANSLVISERTVETHITNILAKLEYSSRSQVAAWAVETGIAARS